MACLATRQIYARTHKNARTILKKKKTHLKRLLATPLYYACIYDIASKCGEQTSRRYLFTAFGFPTQDYNY
jgi:hypothetical protein